MKHLLSAILFFVAAFSSVAQTYEQTCHFGITFEISNNPNWGYGEPVILTVEPNSPAEIAGIKPGDIIMEINGSATFLRNYQTIASWLFNNTSDVATFTVRNLNTYFKEYELPRHCLSVNSIRESDIASSFSFYSLENTQERMFVLPLSVKTNKKVDYSDYHTYGFLDEDKTTDLDKFINKELEKVLNDRGLTKVNENPDIIIQTYYSYQPNTKYNPSVNLKDGYTSRYNIETKEIVLVPILSGDDTQAEYKGQFVLEFGLKFFEKKYIDTENLTQIWECSVREYLTNTFSLEQYVPLHAPLIMMQFPYATDRALAKYIVSSKKYFYTGLNFDVNDMKTITDVDRNSPAYQAGIRSGGVVEKINDQKFAYSKDELLTGYKRFITETMVYRNPRTLFVDAKGFPDCMYWNLGDYDNVRKALTKDVYAPAFKYLYGFERYISAKPASVLNIEVKNRGRKNVFKVIPEERSSITLRAL